MEKLDQNIIKEKLKELPGWFLDKDTIRKDWKFGNFKEALSFINKMGELAEKHNHHPELFNVYNQVTLRFRTHDVGGVTEKDFSIAHDIEAL